MIDTNIISVKSDAEIENTKAYESNFWSLYRRAINLLAVTIHQLKWRRRFNKFGWRSRLGHCDILRNPKGIAIGKRVLIRDGARLEVIGERQNRLPTIIIGDGTSIQFYFHCGAVQSVTIGKNVLISGRVYISDHDHVYDDPSLPPRLCQALKSAPVTIEDGAWLGEGCVILKGVIVGERAVVGANAVVTKDVPPFTVVAGVPARVIRKIERLGKNENAN